MARKGVTQGMEFALCTNEIDTALWGGTAAQLKDRMGLPAKASLRDNVDNIRLTDLDFTESLATRMSQQTLDAGGTKMAVLNKTTGQMVRRTIDAALVVALNGGVS
jgi:hypothetical protein